MKQRLALLLAAVMAFFTLSATAAPQRVVSLGGPLTEIVYALGAGNRLIGVDQSSTYPEAAKALPKVGYYRAFSLEGVVALKPDLVLASDQAGPPQALEQLRRLGLRVIVLPSAPTLDALEQRMHGVAAALGLRNDGRAMVTELRKQVDALAAKQVGPTRALLLINRSGNPEGAGIDTSADAMLKLAGYRNVLSAQKGYKPLSLEGIAALKPDLIVTSTASLAASGGLDALLARPGIAATPAAKNRRVIVMDDLLLLGYGPRLPQALRELKAAPALARQ
ncbi:heme/hemin ABC transporter substrate-binding protein [Jeongeupia naejangsanensis]|uniref:Hemin ABC transporter substrate-binding protein n=1 Tax=Jeongeupia naejangsanensis TaxID=613195 RepID=A0ABS2BIR2_9NEIS|nr:hemin ABC transporter substrate-binding protein [Jeongeupia naejangsanensis]MBM3115499.1 hemin ABC transporter substrate-binding protein [Jeongeupia naejangsanensis]